MKNFTLTPATLNEIANYIANSEIHDELTTVEAEFSQDGYDIFVEAEIAADFVDEQMWHSEVSAYENLSHYEMSYIVINDITIYDEDGEEVEYTANNDIKTIEKEANKMAA